MALERILITGANGLLGQELIRQIAHHGSYQLLATGQDEQSRMGAPKKYDYARLDVCNARQIHEILKGYHPACVINCAAKTGVDDCEVNRDLCWRTNAEAVGHLAKVCHCIGARLIQISTDFVFDGLNGPYREYDRPHPINYYGKSKLAGENEVRATGIGKWAIVRTNVVYGTAIGTPNMDFVQWVLNKLRAKQEIHVYTNQWRTPSYTYDLVRGILRIVHFQKSGVYNLSGREFISMYEFARSIAEAFDLDQSLIQPTVQHLTPQVAQRPEYTGLVTLKAETELNFQPFPLKAALEHIRLRSELPPSGNPLVHAWC